jgi:hypothetical protein
MSFIIGTIIFIALIIVCKKLSRFFFRAADYFDERDRRKNYHETCIRESLQDIRGAVAPPDEDSGVDYKTRLLNANHELIEKNKLSKAMEDELGIKL